jgi:hypothetical protein
MPKKTKTEIKTAIKNVLNKVTIGSEGGSINGSIVITGENNFVKAPAFKIGDTDLSTFIEEAGKVKTVNNQQPDSTGNIDIPISVNNIQRDDTGNITLTPSDVGASASDHTHAYLPLAGGTMTGQIYVNARESSWFDGRTSALIRIANGVGYNVLASMQCAGYSWEIGCEGSNNGNAMRIGCVSDTNFSGGTNTQNQYFRFDLNGDFIASRDIRATSWVYATNFRVSSDRRLKTDIKKAEYSLPEVELKTFRFKADERKAKHIGFIAQDIQEQVPDIVNEDETTKRLTIDESALLAIAVDEINKLKKRVTELEKR